MFFKIFYLKCNLKKCNLSSFSKYNLNPHIITETENVCWYHISLFCPRLSVIGFCFFFFFFSVQSLTWCFILCSFLFFSLVLSVCLFVCLFVFFSLAIFLRPRSAWVQVTVAFVTWPEKSRTKFESFYFYLFLNSSFCCLTCSEKRLS